MKAATIKDVASRAEVSVASVSRVLNDNGPVTPETRARVLKAVEALRYVPHSGARSLITRKTDTIGVILPDLFGEFFSEMIRGLDLAAQNEVVPPNGFEKVPPKEIDVTVTVPGAKVLAPETAPRPRKAGGRP